MRRRHAAQLACLVLLAGCGSTVDRAVERAWQRGLAYLAAAQGEDGAWHSEAYGVLRPGHSLTAIAVYAFALAPPPMRRAHATTVHRGLSWLAAHTGDDGAIGLAGPGLDYPNYTAAFYLLALSALQPENAAAKSAAQVAYLRTAQLAEHRGWQPDDVEYGGFAFGGRNPDKPLDTELLSVAVSAWAVAALRAAGVPPEDPTLRRARRFVLRCRGADGGFHFTPTPPHARSKAGADAGAPRSYGSATADGLRAWLLCGGDPAVADAALDWLRAHFSVDTVPGFAPDAQRTADGMRIYYLTTLARALQRAGEHGWRTPVRDALLAHQREDGAFAGLNDTMKEDDPLVATPLALIGLAATTRPAR